MSRKSNGEGSITQRKDGRWEARLQVDGVRRVVYGKTRAQVVAKLNDLKVQAHQAGGSLPDPGKRTLNDLLDVWLETKAPSLKPRTLFDYRSECDRYIRPALGNIALHQVTPLRIQRLLNRYETQGHARVARQVYRRLSQALDLAVRWDWLAVNPCRKVDNPVYRPKRKVMWTLEEMRVFLEGTHDHWLYPMWLTAIGTGCRLGELLALTWDDVDLSAETLSVTKSVQTLDGERVVTTPKTASGVRTLSIPPEVVQVLKRHQAVQAEQRLRMGKRWEGEDLVFTSRAGEPLHQSTVQWTMHGECDRLELPRLTPHGLRHLHASVLLSEGLSIPDVSRRLGHASPAITMTTYAHVVTADDRGAAEAIGRALGVG
jgi:integrase